MYRILIKKSAAKEMELLPKNIFEYCYRIYFESCKKSTSARLQEAKNTRRISLANSYW